MRKKLLAVLLALALVLGLASFAGAATHVVEKGDNLSKLAEQYLGSRLKWREIYEANKDKISDPNSIYVGQELVIPGSENDPVETPDPGPQEFESKAPYMVNTVPESDPGYWQAELEAQIYNYKMVRNYPTLYAKEAWDAAQSAGTVLLAFDPEALTDNQKAMILAARDAIAALAGNQIKPFGDGINGEIIYIWGDDMPVTTPAEELVFTTEIYDNADFEPYIIPYLLDNPGEAKGTVIVASGGGNSSRSNPVEAYAVCPEFNKLGYNCFLLQRRVQPYNNDDIVMDLQRTVRVVKYYAEDWGIDLEGTLLAVSGYSGSGGNIRTMLQKFYGNITPDQFDAGYVCDEIDALNSDVDIAHFIYSGSPIETENPNLPHMFIAVGADDGFNGSIELFKQAYEMGLDPELHIYGLNGHGFGAGMAGTSSMTWMETCDMYMQKVMGYAEISYEGEIPPEYVLHQEIHVTWFPIGDDVLVNAYTTADHGKFLFTFFGWGDNIMVEGILIGDRVADVTYDSVGYFGADAPKMWDLVDPAAWTPVK